MCSSSNLIVHADYKAMCRHVAAQIGLLVRRKPNAVLGLATGFTPIGVYEELVRLHQQEGLDFSEVVCFNLDEYMPMAPESPQSYHHFMRQHLFDHINCPSWNIPSGLVPVEEVESYCQNYEAMIQNAGGLDFQLLGIGRSGHIGFNEPGSSPDSRTRMVALDSVTRRDAATDFFGLETVPARAITMGIDTILSAREIAIIATGALKAAIVAESLEGKITSKVPASFLRKHPKVVWHLDPEAAGKLTQYASPWLGATFDWDDFSVKRRALFTASFKSGKPLAELTTPDLAHAGVPPLDDEAKLEDAKMQCIVDLEARLDDARLPQRKTVLCLSPHPDDDVICCGATLLKMSELGNQIFVVFGVNGANAVRDKDVLALLRARHPRLVSYLEENLEPGKSLEDAVNAVRSSIFEREPGAPDASLLRELKRLVREGEASDACRKMGAKPVFLNLPFYSDGAHRLPIGDVDVARMLEMLEQTAPDLVLLTGEKNDPHGTHVLCEQAFDLAAEQYAQAGGKPFARWNYRGAWDDYQTFEGDYFSVFDKRQMEKKIGLILDHISQLDPLFPGDQTQEFWERARDRNRENARQLQRLGVLEMTRSFDPVFVEVFRIAPC